MKRKIIILLIIAFFITSGFYALNIFVLEKSLEKENSLTEESTELSIDSEKEKETIIMEEGDAVEDEEEIAEEEFLLETTSVVQDVPFIIQAPFGKWSNPVFQDGCEEAAILMSKYWISNKTITEEKAEKEILELVDFEKENYDFYIDTSAKDTAKIMRDYIDIESIWVENDITVDDIIQEIMKKNIVVVPANGRKLSNPFFTPPGPENHMLVIIGYDSETKEFIANDSGTKRGKGYKYNENIVFEAIRDYPSGNHEPNPGIEKNMIVVSKN